MTGGRPGGGPPRGPGVVVPPRHLHALLGKNGSGELRLVKIIAGAERPTEASTTLAGASYEPAGPSQARAAGIVTVRQELRLVPNLDLAENLFLGALPRRGLLRQVDWRTVRREAERLLADMGLDLDPARPAGPLSLGQRQSVEIARAMRSEPRVLLLDEPTSALGQAEAERLFAPMRRLRARGVTMVYISHRLQELAGIADTVTVLRDGRHVGSAPMAGLSTQGVAGMMFGEMAGRRRERRPRDPEAPVVLRVEGLSRGRMLQEASFELRRGEVLGIAGMMGSGRTELLRAVFGAEAPEAGRVEVEGVAIPRPSPAASRAAGLGYTPENRKEAGLVQILSCRENLALARLPALAPKGRVHRREEAALVARQRADLAIEFADPEDPVSSLSGGNQQKIVLGKWFATEPKVMLLDEPSRGIDVEAKAQIFDILASRAKAGLASDFVSSELEEVHEVADRILVMRSGRIVAELRPEDVSLSDLYALCAEAEPPAAIPEAMP